MAFNVQTPQRPLPGAYLQTPAPSRFQSGQIALPTFRSNLAPSTQQDGSQIQNQSLALSTQQLTSEGGKPPIETLKPIDRAAKTINEVLALETKYPELDSYIGQGISSDYDISSQSAWAPFQKIKMYDIPDKIFEQYNRAQVSTMMGLFADFNHAWVSIDNALYVWDYTHPNPDLIGFEQQPNTITAVRLVVPRAGVFVPQITRLLVVATTVDIHLVGFSAQLAPSGGHSVSLYATRMSISIKGIDVNNIEGSAASGRIFFSGRGSDDVLEITYQQEERWFQNRCAKINHTSKGLSTFAPSFPFGQRPQQEYITQMAVDDTRKLIYTLSSRSTIRTFHMKSNGGLDLVISKPFDQTLNNIGHMTSQSALISSSMTIVSINPMSSQEASKLHLMATTSTGCRVFMSATSSYGWSVTDSANAPSSMQVQHVKFPPSDPVDLQARPQGGSPHLENQVAAQGINTSSKALVPTRTAVRYPPGYFFCFVSNDPQGITDSLFVSGPDSGRIARPPDASRLPRYTELGIWLNLSSRAEDIGLASEPFSAASSPTGFGNELAVQYDKAVSEVAILTNTGVHTLRRRRLVDMFAAAIRLGGGDEGLEGEVKRFIRQYGRGETASTALAVACGQGLDVTSDSRLARITDPDILEFARRAFIDYGGKPQFNENSIVDHSLPAIDLVRPSPRHEGLSLYVARLVRSIWKALIAQEMTSATGGLAVASAVSLTKLRDIQRDLSKVKEFLDSNKRFIEGLAGPEALGRVSTKQEEISLQAEHRALHSIQVLINDIIEGISFVLVLFDEQIEEIILSLANETRQQLRGLTYEGLFSTTRGKDLAKELVKAIVNRNIANGSNVETVAEALRRRCGSFCSADDVIIFKAQEQLKKASEAGADTEFGRNLLNESLRLFKQVAANLSMEQLHWAVQQFLQMQFFAGAIQLALDVAQESDRGNRALSWIQDGRPEPDPRISVFESRKRCYDLIHHVILALDQASQAPETDVPNSLSIKRRMEAYDVVDSSMDEVFQTDLYDWYLAQGRTERLLEIQSPFIVTYLQRKSTEDIDHANLLWKYYSQTERYNDAAGVQLALAKSEFLLPLNRRIEYLSLAKANANTYAPGIARPARQILLREISDLLDIANIQDDVLQRLRGDERITPQRRPEVLQNLNGPILSLTELYNNYADQAGYFDICLLIYQAADHRNPADIRANWQNLLEHTHQEVSERGEPLPYEAVIEKVRTLAPRVNLSETMFPINDLLPMLKRYAFEYQRDVGPPTWVTDTLLEVGVPHESLFSALEAMFYGDEAPFRGPNSRYLTSDLLHVVQLWYRHTLRGTGTGSVLGGEENASAVSHTLQALVRDGRLDPDSVELCQVLRSRIEGSLM